MRDTVVTLWDELYFSRPQKTLSELYGLPTKKLVFLRAVDTLFPRWNRVLVAPDPKFGVASFCLKFRQFLIFAMPLVVPGKSRFEQLSTDADTVDTNISFWGCVSIIRN